VLPNSPPKRYAAPICIADGLYWTSARAFAKLNEVLNKANRRYRLEWHSSLPGQIWAVQLGCPALAQLFAFMRLPPLAQAGIG